MTDHEADHRDWPAKSPGDGGVRSLPGVMAPVVPRAALITAWWPVVGSLLAVAIVNACSFVDHELTILYVLPLLLAAQRLSPRGVTVATVAALLLLVATEARTDTPWSATTMAVAALLAVSYLAWRLAVQRTRTAQRTRVAEAQVVVAEARTRQAESLVELGELLRICTTAAEVDAVVGRIMPRLLPGSAGALYHLSL